MTDQKDLNTTKDQDEEQNASVEDVEKDKTPEEEIGAEKEEEIEEKTDEQKGVLVVNPDVPGEAKWYVVHILATKTK